MFSSKNKKNNVYPCKSQFYCIKVGSKGVKIICVCFRDAIKSTKNRIHSFSTGNENTMKKTIKEDQVDLKQVKEAVPKKCQLQRRQSLRLTSQ